MRPATIRRLLVFGVCLVGVGCLYLLPSRAGAPSRVGSTAARSDLPTVSAPSPTVVTALSAEPTTGSTEATNRDARTSVRTADQRPDQRRRSGDQEVRATAVEPGDDASLPPEVDRLTLVSADNEHLVISWPEVDDDHLVGYEVWLNGFFVITVPHARARLVWFNDSDTHVIQVRALDDHGREGPASPTLLVNRPTVSPEPTTPASTEPTTPGPASTPTTSAAPPARDDNADPPLTQTIAPSPTTTEAGGSKENGS